MTTIVPRTVPAAGDGAGKAPSSAHPGPRQPRTDWGKRFEIALLSGPAIVIFLAFVIVPVNKDHGLRSDLIYGIGIDVVL